MSLSLASRNMQFQERTLIQAAQAPPSLLIGKDVNGSKLPLPCLSSLVIPMMDRPKFKPFVLRHLTKQLENTISTPAAEEDEALSGAGISTAQKVFLSFLEKSPQAALPFLHLK